MAIDFRADQVRLNRLISSGSTPILIYPSSSASDLAGGQTAEFVTSSVGTDVFLFVSGATDGTGKTLFGGDAVVSGNVRIDQSLAQGNSVVASGLYSHAQGFATNATNFYTHAEGINTNATGFYSHAEGNLTTASGIAAHAEGLGSLASGLYSHAEGDSATASGDYSHAEGSGSVASGKYSHAEGYLSIASGIAAHAEGNLTIASGDYSYAKGDTTTASGDYSHAEGFGTNASGIYSHAEGGSTTASGQYSHAEGDSTVALGLFSHAEGNSTTALGDRSHAEGFSTTACGEASHAQGYGSETFGTGSFAAGLYTVASGAVDGTSPPTTTQAAFGKYNLRDNITSLFVIGDGLDDTNRHDILRVESGSVQVTGSLFVNGVQITGGGGGGGGTQKQFIAKYEETTSTSTVVIGQFSWVPSDYAGLTALRVRAVMSTDGTANHTGSLQIYNLTSGSYIDLINTPSIDTVFNITSSIPTLVTSSNLLSGTTNFDNVTTSIYEVRISGSTANSTIIGGVELVYS